jgi:hypothetical protein
MKLPAASFGVSKRNSPKLTAFALQALAGRHTIHPCNKMQGILAKANKNMSF